MDEKVNWCSYNKGGLHILGQGSKCSICNEFNQISPETLKGGFKAAAGKAMFSLVPMTEFEYLILDCVTIPERYMTLFFAMTGFWRSEPASSEANRTLSVMFKESLSLLAELTGDKVSAMFQLGELFTLGSTKYAKRNWEKGIDWDIVWSAMMRHFLYHVKGELRDPIDNQYHMTSVLWNAVVLARYNSRYNQYKTFDERKNIIVAEDKGQR